MLCTVLLADDELLVTPEIAGGGVGAQVVEDVDDGYDGYDDGHGIDDFLGQIFSRETVIGMLLAQYQGRC